VVNRKHTRNNNKMTRKKKNNKTKSIKRKRYNLAAVFDKHIKHEFQDHDVDATMKTMVGEPYVHHVPMMTGGIGYDSVYNFYKNHFVGKMPDDTKIELLLTQQ
jgi:carboxymethylenebutenolidase